MVSQVLLGTVRTVKFLATYNASTTSILSVTSTNMHRAVHSNLFLQERLTPNVRRAVEKIKGPRPRQPLPPYFRFMQQMRPKIAAEYPHLKKNKLYPMFSERWRSLEAKEKAIFAAAYRNDMHKYLQEISQYNREISRDDIQQMQKELEENEDKKQIKLYQKQAEELNKPKRPEGPFFKFLHLKCDRRPDELYKDYIKRMSSRWRSLSEKKRKKYEMKPEEMANYKKAMREWEDNLQKSIADGNGDSFQWLGKYGELNAEEDAEL